jgi:putative transposase
MCSRAFQYRAYLTDEQFVLAMKTVGACRFVYNNALDYKTTEYRNNRNTVSYTQLSARLTGLKKELPWLKEVDSIALQQSLRHLDTAFQNFFRKKKGTRYPKYKSKHRSKWSYTTMSVNNNLRFEDDALIMPKLGRISIRPMRPVPEDWKLKSAVLTIERDHTVYISCCFEYDDVPVQYTPDPGKAIGLDYKSDGFCADSEGHVCGSPKYARKAQEALTRQQRKLRHKKKGSRNYEKQKLRIAKVYRHIANQRLDFCHQQSVKTANSYDIVCVEDLDLKAMSNRSFRNGRATMDNGYGMFLRFLEYKLHDRGKVLVKVGKWFPSSQICHVCGRVNPELKDLRIRHWTCPGCGTGHERDINSAINILQEGLRLYLQNAA